MGGDEVILPQMDLSIGGGAPAEQVIRGGSEVEAVKHFNRSFQPIAYGDLSDEVSPCDSTRRPWSRSTIRRCPRATNESAERLPLAAMRPLPVHPRLIDTASAAERSYFESYRRLPGSF
jgi:hypothetical protein